MPSQCTSPIDHSKDTDVSDTVLIPKPTLISSESSVDRPVTAMGINPSQTPQGINGSLSRICTIVQFPVNPNGFTLPSEWHSFY